MRWRLRWKVQVNEVKWMLLTCVLMAVLSGCGQQMEPHSATLFAMDTVMELTVYGGESLLAEGEELILDIEQRLLVTDSNSEIAGLNRDGKATVSSETKLLLEDALALCERTDGALDITVYPVVRAWGFTTGEYQVPDEIDLANALALVDYHKVRLDSGTALLPSGMQIDLGSVAKGWAGDKILEMFRQRGIESALLNLGGNVQALGVKPDGSPWRVAVRDPAGEGYAGALEVTDQAVVTSGGYQRYFEEGGQVYHHIIDPKTGWPASNGLLSVTVIGDSGTACDGLSTALFVMGLERALAFWETQGDFEAIFIMEDKLVITDGLADSFEPLGKYADMKAEVRYSDKD